MIKIDVDTPENRNWIKKTPKKKPVSKKSALIERAQKMMEK